MSNELEILAKALLATPNGAKVLGNIDKLSKMLNGAEGKKLVEQLSGGGGDALKKAAESAATGDGDRAKNLLSSLLSTPEGAKLAKQIVEAVK